MEYIIIEQPWGGLGDNLQFSTLPELGFSKNINVFISNKNKYLNSGIFDLVWKCNPYVKGFTEQSGNTNHEYLDFFKYFYKGNIIERWEQMFFGDSYNNIPKLYYKPNNLSFFKDKTIVDISAISSKIPLELIIKKHKDAIFINYSDINLNCIFSKDIFEWVDIITSAKKFICQYSGGSVVMAAYNIPCTVYKRSPDKLYTFSMHEYIEI